jgi:hypothetical protein
MPGTSWRESIIALYTSSVVKEEGMSVGAGSIIFVVLHPYDARITRVKSIFFMTATPW